MGTCFTVTLNKFLYLNCNKKFKQNCIKTNLSFFANYCTNMFHTYDCRIKYTVPKLYHGLGQFSQYSDLLRAGWSGDWILVGARSSAHIKTSPGDHPASYTMGTRSLLGVKQPGHGVDHPPASSSEVKERVELYLYSPFRSSWPVLRWTYHFT